MPGASSLSSPLPPSSMSRTLTFALRPCAAYACRFPSASGCAPVGARWMPWGLPLERAAARICREAGARVAENVRLRDLNLDAPVLDDRRLEVVANALPIWGGVQVAVDTTTLVSPVRADGAPRPGADREPGLALRQIRRRKRHHTLTLSASGAGAAACLSSASRSVAGGSRTGWPSCACSRAPSRAVSPNCCAERLRRRTCGGGLPSSQSPRSARSPPACCSSRCSGRRALMAPSRR